MRRQLACFSNVFLLSAAALAFQIGLILLFSILQFYHFAFLVVSLALLGYGASGTLLTIFPQLKKSEITTSLQTLGLAGALSMVGAYLVFNYLPFDPYAVFVQPHQWFLLIFQFLALSLPFFCNGLAVALCLDHFREDANRVYAATLIGSAAGCALIMALPGLVGAEGVVAICAVLACMASLIVELPACFIKREKSLKLHTYARIKNLISVITLILLMIAIVIRATGSLNNRIFALRLSPYKGLSYALQFPGAKRIFSNWNAYSRVDVVASDGIRSLPGLSYRFPGLPPAQKGVFIDGDDLSPLIEPQGDLSFSSYLPQASAYRLRPHSDVLILEPHAGLDVLVAHELGAKSITAVEPNELVIKAAQDIFNLPLVRLIHETGRSFLRQDANKYDVIILSLTSAFHPINSGDFSLGEDYRFTVESFQDAIKHLKSDGILLVNRWLQMPSSEELRAFGLAIAALEEMKLDPSSRLVAFRGYNMATVLVKRNPFTASELQNLRSFMSEMSFDLIYSPDIQPDEVNRYNILSEPVYYRTFSELLHSPSRSEWYRAYPYDVQPPSDNHPFFSHYFKWTQLDELIAGLGRTWQPFGGAGYLVLLVMLLVSIILSCILILLPLALKRMKRTTLLKYKNKGKPDRFRWALYFFLIGCGFMLVEIPLFQRLILYLGQLAYSLTVVLAGLLFFSGIGSFIAPRIKSSIPLMLIAVILVLTSLLLRILFEYSLGLSFIWRVFLTMILIAPLGFFMGMAFPKGIRVLQKEHPELVSWMWGINGAASVVSSVAAAILALSFGFSVVFWCGAACYLGAWLVTRRVWARVEVDRG